MQGFYSYPSFFEHMEFKHFFRRLSACTNEYLVTNSVSIVTFTLCIPLYEFLVYPLLRNYIPPTKVRIALGFIVSLLGLSALLAIDVAGHLHAVSPDSSVCMFYDADKGQGKIEIHPLLLIPVIIVMAFGEMLVFISTLEFIVAQSPYGMRGLILGLFFMLYGIFVGLGTVLMMVFSFAFKKADFSKQPSCGTSFITSVVGIGCVGAILYFISMRQYKERQRGGQVDINHQTILEGYYER